MQNQPKGRPSRRIHPVSVHDPEEKGLKNHKEQKGAKIIADKDHQHGREIS
jgi:hypothetical protein